MKPTARHHVGEAHDTSVTSTPLVAVLVCTCQVSPSHPTTSPVWPTAMHDIGDAQEIACK
jgi:hypothetical protein